MRYSTEILDPAALTDAERQRFTDDLYATHCRIFRGVSRDEFAAYVVDSPAGYTRIFLLRDEEGTLRGYCAFHVFIKAHADGPMAVVRMETGTEKAWRRSSSSGPFIFRELLRLCVRYPRHRRLLVASLVHPSPYVAMHRHAPEMWPTPRQPTPPHIAALLGELAEMFQMTPAARSGIVKVGWVTRDACAPRRISPEAAFFTARNPDYLRGEGMVTMIPLSLGHIVQGAASYARYRLRRLAGGPTATTWAPGEWGPAGETAGGSAPHS